VPPWIKGIVAPGIAVKVVEVVEAVPVSTLILSFVGEHVTGAACAPAGNNKVATSIKPIRRTNIRMISAELTLQPIT
jgi:hypothetical protein